MNASDGLDPAVDAILESARERTPPSGQSVQVNPRSFQDAVAAARKNDRVPIIAEVKPRSPTSEFDRSEDPVEIARTMVDAGAMALSVLTEPEHFGGSPETLSEIRDVVDVPILRKDFILREEQLDVVEADLVLLIARFVDDLQGLLDAATDRGFQVLVEAHTADEVDAAIDAGAEIIGINNRDLAALEVSLETFERIAPSVPDDFTLVAESGIQTPDDVRRMRSAGADALLVGSAIMAGNIQERTEALAEATP